MRRLTYEELARQLEDVPTTQIAGLLQVIVERAIKANVFAPNGLIAFVNRVIERAKK